MTITAITVVQGIALQPGPVGPQGEQGPPGAITTLDIPRGWMSLQYMVPTDVPYVTPGPTTWDTLAHPSARITILGGATVMAPPINVIEGAYYAIRFVQDSPARTVTWDATGHYHWPGGAVNAVLPSNIPGAVDVFHFRGAPGNVLEFVGAQLNLRA
jgi:hypothetical protein